MDDAKFIGSSPGEGLDQTIAGSAEYQWIVSSKDRSSIRPDRLHAGIILVSSIDPIGRLIKTLTHQDFSSIGFYYRDSMDAGDEIRTILARPFSRNLTSELAPGQTLRRIMENPLVDRVAVQRLKPVRDAQGHIDSAATGRRQRNFRSAIARVVMEIRSHDESRRSDLVPLFKRLIGVQEGPDDSQTGLGLVNQVINQLVEVELEQESADQDHNSSTTDSASFSDDETQVRLLGRLDYLESIVDRCRRGVSSSDDHPLEKRLIPNDLFGSLRWVQLPARDPIIVERIYQRSLEQSRELLDRSCRNFVDLVIQDPSFFELVNETLDRDRSRSHFYLQLLRLLIRRVLKQRLRVVQGFLSAVTVGYLEYQELVAWVQELDRIASEVATIIGSNREPPLTMPPLERNRTIRVRLNRLRGRRTDQRIEESLLELPNTGFLETFLTSCLQQQRRLFQRLRRVIRKGRLKYSMLDTFVRTTNLELQVGRLVHAAEGLEPLTLPEEVVPSLEISVDEDQLSDKIEPDSLAQAVRSLHRQVRRLTEAAETGQPIIELDRLVEATNYITSHGCLSTGRKRLPSVPRLKSPAKISSYSALVVSGQSHDDETIKTQNVWGDEIVISCRNPDLTQLDRATLYELLAMLDHHHPEPDQRFDELKAKIVDRLARKD